MDHVKDRHRGTEIRGRREKEWISEAFPGAIPRKIDSHRGTEMRGKSREERVDFGSFYPTLFPGR
ncbi:MAG: hypothetical protein ACLQMF_05015 [Rectinemataceae bacterium]